MLHIKYYYDRANEMREKAYKNSKKWIIYLTERSRYTSVRPEVSVKTICQNTIVVACRFVRCQMTDPSEWIYSNTRILA